MLDGLQVKASMLKDILRVSVCIERILPLKKNARANYAWPFLYTEVGIHPLLDSRMTANSKCDCILIVAIRLTFSLEPWQLALFHYVVPHCCQMKICLSSESAGHAIARLVSHAAL